ncbi:MAG: hypothetical protein ACYTAQ_07485 [Planctomycetota bacterium]
MFMTTRACCGGLCAAVVIASWPAVTFGQSIRISEVRVDQPGADLDEFFELAGPTGAALGGLTYIVIGDGAAGNNGVLEEVTDLGGQALDERPVRRGRGDVRSGDREPDHRAQLRERRQCDTLTRLGFQRQRRRRPRYRR